MLLNIGLCIHNNIKFLCNFPGVPGKKNSVNYECCPEPYVDITFTIHIGLVLILI